MNYRPFIGLVASFFLLDAITQDRVAPFAQYASLSDRQSVGEISSQKAVCALLLAVPPLQSAMLSTVVEEAFDLLAPSMFLARGLRASPVAAPGAAGILG
ncbi:MAG: hypothetical protein MK171_06375 [Pirellulales bacterium]|nr:hypothetical protein [Pirellulales bacterium]